MTANSVGTKNLRLTNPLTYQNDELYIEGVSISELAARVPTPFYCYSRETIEAAYSSLSRAMKPVNGTVSYAVKANGNLTVLKLLGDLGSGMDVVSVGELERALVAGIPPERIVFSGVGKQRAEIARALEVGIHQLNVESANELYMIESVAASLGVMAPVAFRVNPDVDAGTHTKISTGRLGDKFGVTGEMALDLYAYADRCPHLSPEGLAVHIGSQILDLAPFRKAFEIVRDLVLELREMGHRVQRLDLGGGLGIPYGQEAASSVDDYCEMIADIVGPLGCSVIVEPGRWLVGEAGLLVSSVVLTKEGDTREIAVIDAGMNDLMRPALYDAVHSVIPVSRR